MSTPRHDHAGKRGFVLVSVLWLGTFLIVLLAALLQQGRVTLAVTRTGLGEVTADAMLTASLELLAARLAGGGTAADGDGRAKSERSANGTVLVAAQDMNGLVDLNRAPAPLIAALAAAARDDRAADAILARRASPGAPVQSPFRSREELADADGVTPEAAAFAADYTTVFATNGTINPLTAPVAVLRLLPGVDAAVAAKIVAVREHSLSDSGPVFALLPGTSALVAPAPLNAYDVYIEATVTGGLTKSVRATMLFDGDASRPYRLLDWHPWAARPAWVRRGAD